MNVEKLLLEMTLEEKAGMLSGRDFWRTKAVERLGIPSMMVSDGPHGLRKQDAQGDHLGMNESIKAVCFPAGCALASSFNRDMMQELGEIIGEECQAEGVGVILGPAVNIKRSPLCGRNFEYFSEDPRLASDMAEAFIKGVQSKHVGTSMKHFLANNQEYRRMTSSSEVDQRTLREIYLAAFEGAVKGAKPWTVMCAYNKINGVYAAENHQYLTQVLREEWGFDGFVVSDWGAVNDRVADLKAGLDLEMPDSAGITDRLIVEAVENGQLDMKYVDEAVRRILKIIDRFESNRDHSAVFDREKDHEKARAFAGECMVLLKNENVLPLDKDAQVAFIGAFADKPRYQGGGSSHINPYKVESALEMASAYQVAYAKGYDIEKDAVDDALADEAIQLAKASEAVVIFAGLPDIYESEGFDRKHMRLPEYQNALIEAITKVNDKVIVVLHNGSPVEMPWIDKVEGVLEAYLGGQAVGGATVDCLFGEVNPSGRLAETFPLKLEDNPSYLYFLGEKDKVEYREGVFVGYRYYDKKAMKVLFPFGHGLTYTRFAYSELTVDKSQMTDSDTLRVSVEVKNIGDRAGKEVVQLYVAPLEAAAIRPVKEFKRFEKLDLAPGQTKTVHFELSRRDFAYFNMEVDDWFVESGDYGIVIGQSVEKEVARTVVTIKSSDRIPVVYDMDSTLGDMLADERSNDELEALIERFSKAFMGDAEGGEVLGEGSQLMFKEMIHNMPLRNIVSFGGVLDYEDCRRILSQMNG